MYNEPNLIEKNNFRGSSMVKRDNGNPMALIYVQGRMAYQQGKCIFKDCPYQPGTEQAEKWQEGHAFESNKDLASKGLLAQ